jgi:chemotaxis regulatin CheY-phosphate phosphatase CheZ
MSRERQQAVLTQRQKVLRSEFVNVELDLAITFCEIAASTNDAEKNERNMAHARKAYKAAMHFMRTTDASEPLKTQIDEKMKRLQSLLSELQQ